MHWLKSVALISLLTISGGAVAQSADGSTSRLNALACENLPTPLQTDVVILDDTKRNLAYKALFEKELRGKGVLIAGAAPTVATLDIRIVRELPVKPEGNLFERGASPANRDIGRDTPESGLGNVWSNKDTSVFGGPKSHRERLSLNQLQVSVIFNRRDDGRCLWEGDVRHDFHGDEDADALTTRILPILAKALGKTVRNRALNLSP